MSYIQKRRKPGRSGAPTSGSRGTILSTRGFQTNGEGDLQAWDFNAEVNPAGGSLTVFDFAGLRRLMVSGDRSKWYEAEGSRRSLPRFDWALGRTLDLLVRV